MRHGIHKIKLDFELEKYIYIHLRMYKKQVLYLVYLKG